MLRNEVIAFEKGYRVTPEGQVQNAEGLFRKLQPTRDGYQRFSVRLPAGKMVKVSVHRLAAYQLYGEAVFEEGIEVRHLDSVRHNNAHVNLLLGTKSENAMDKPVETRVRCARIAAAKMRRLSEVEVLQLVAEQRRGDSYTVLSARYSLAKSIISYIVNGKTYGHITGITPKTENHVHETNHVQDLIRLSA